MNKLDFKKGNLFNGIDGKIDNTLMDSSQYDLEIKNGKELNYYRIRYEDSFYTAHEINFDSFNVSSYNKNGNSIMEVANFRKTQYFKNIFPFYKEFNKAFYKANRELESYYVFMQRITGKNNINKYETLYRFFLPAIKEREKKGVLSYEIEIELVHRRYYIVFYNEIMEEGYKREEDQYMIYDKKAFTSKKEKIENKVLDLAVNSDYPVNLLEYLYIMTNGDVKLITQFFHELPKFKSYSDLLNSRYFILIRPNKEENSELEKEWIRYFNGDQEDINYSFYNQSRILRK